MKKLLFLAALIAVLGIFPSKVQAQTCDAYSSVVLRGGYNFLEKIPTANVAFFGDFAFFRFQIEIGMVQLKKKYDVSMPLYVSPAIGVSWGEYVTKYFLVGATPWISAISKNDRLVYSLNSWHCKFEGGFDIRINDFFFWNIGAVYLIPTKSTPEQQHLQNLTLLTGLGLNF